jgi:hypothetical protein
MGTRESTRRTRCIAAVKIAFALAALTPGVAAGQEHASPHVVPASAAHVAAAAEGEPPKEAEEWERVRLHRSAH